ncbi:MAG: carboxypeptidase [Cyanobacteria bacterium RYN_339]|nr:carboxypeptidase [Cyanobacteria bacterium RYN_339]
MSSLKRSLALCLTAATVTTAVVAGCGTHTNSPAPLAANEGGWAAVAFSTPTENKPVVVHYKDADTLTQLVNAGVDVWSVDRHAHKAKVVLNATQGSVARKLGMKVDLMTAREATMSVDKGYRTYEQVAARLQELATSNPQIATLVDIGDSWEKTQGRANRDLLALHITGKGAKGTKPVVTFVGGTHAREIATPEMMLMECEKLVTQYGKDAEVTTAVDTRDIWIVPMVNPDGHAHAMKGQSWRKNTNDKDGGHSGPGIDLNRNYGAFWGVNGDSGNPDSDVFRGPKPFSEPETQAIQKLTTEHVPSVYMTFHSFSNSVMWPWDHTHDINPDGRMKIMGEAMAKFSGYDPYQGSEMYLNGGDDEEWVFQNLHSAAFTIEIGTWGDGFMPPYSKIAQFWKENSQMMSYALKVADKPGR